MFVLITQANITRIATRPLVSSTDQPVTTTRITVVSLIIIIQYCHLYSEYKRCVSAPLLIKCAVVYTKAMKQCTFYL